jgi:hypothetical protein
MGLCLVKNIIGRIQVEFYIRCRLVFNMGCRLVFNFQHFRLVHVQR